jgi:uncharacterized protein YkwD
VRHRLVVVAPVAPVAPVPPIAPIAPIALIAFVVLALASPARAADAIGAVNGVRSRPCEGRPAAPAVTRLVALDRAAELIADGQPLRDAVNGAGYRAVQSALVRTEGATTDAQLAELVGRQCAQVSAANLRHIGIHQRGRALWIVLAEPYVVPALERDAVRARVLAAVNAARKLPRRCGNQTFAAAAALRWSATLEKVAAAHANDMARRGVMSHTGGDGSSTEQRVSRAGYAWFSVGENVAGGQRDADEVVRHWLASPGHCANLMNGMFTEMAVGFATNERSELGIYWAQVFAAPDSKDVPPAIRRARPGGA